MHSPIKPNRLKGRAQSTTFEDGFSEIEYKSSQKELQAQTVNKLSLVKF